jgi:hypothetical protein
MIRTLSHPARRRSGYAAHTARAWRSTAQLLLSAALCWSALQSAQTAEIPFEQQLLAEARLDADSIVQHRRCLARCSIRTLPL